MRSLNELKNSYEKKKSEIKERLEDFKKVWKKSDEDVFVELCFCLLTPQSKARVADRAIKSLLEKNILFSGNKEQILKELTISDVRFPENKAKYIIEARDFFTHDGKIDIKSKLDKGTVDAKREWLVKNVKGLGYKEASHFLRNIGLGFNLAILDRHIMKNLMKYGIIDDIPERLSRKYYLFFEEKMKQFSERVDIPMADLDLLFWSEETGEVFK
ncbi:MAG: N-glycosylase/DNA lyase [Candidatus Aenigmarchaeota archaeon]|nr:N-glycosylase/DNA lyase [Candidatus Aenigmarchaeota archaeon]